MSFVTTTHLGLAYFIANSEAITSVHQLSVFHIDE